MKSQGWLIALVSSFLITACSNPPGDSVVLDVIVPPAHPYSSMSEFLSPGEPRSFLAAPDAVTGFNCMMANVIGPGIGSWSTYQTQISAGGTCSYFGNYSNLAQVSNGGTLSVNVSPGPQRYIQMLGIQTASGTCPTLSSSTNLNDTSTFEGIYEIGRTVTDIFTPSSIVVKNSYSASGASDVRCTTKTAVAATPTPSPNPAAASAALYFDAEFASSSFGAQSTACGTTTWHDLSGNGNTGTLTNFTCSGTSGWSGSGSNSSPMVLNFDGAGYVTTSLSEDPTAVPTTTWEAWVYPTRLNYATRQEILSTDNGGYDRALLIEFDTSLFGIFVGLGLPSPFIWWPAVAQINQWQHVVVEFSATNVLFYLNGVKYSYGSAPNYDGSNDFFTIGNRSALGEPFQGAIALVAVYHKSLTQTEVSSRCNALASRFSGVTCN